MMQTRSLFRGMLLAALLTGQQYAYAQDDGEPPLPPEAPQLPGPGRPSGLPVPAVTTPASKEAKEEVAPNASNTGSVNGYAVPCTPPSARISMDFVDTPLMDMIKYMAEVTCRNFILGEELKGQITIISHQQVSASEAYEAFLSALEVAGYTTVTVGRNTKVVPTSEASTTPLRVYEDGDIPATDNFVTQIIQLENVSASEISSLVKELSGSKARVVVYNPTNTLIITDAAFNIRRVYRIIKQLDVAAPRSKIEIIPIRYSTAAEVERILEEIFEVTASSSSSSSAASASAATGTSRRRTRDSAGAKEAAPAASAASATTIGGDAVFISKIISDERTNSLIIQANEEALTKIKEVISQIDIDIDPFRRSQIHVVYLDHAKAEDLASVLSNLTESTGGSSSSRSSSSSSSSRPRSSTSGSAPRPSTGGPSRAPGLPGGAPGDGPAGATIASMLENVEISADENTNSLVIVASPEDFRLLKGVIDLLDIPRRQVYVEAVVLEVGSEDETEVGSAIHSALGGSEAGNLSYGAVQLGTSSLGVNVSDLSSGLTFGVLGQSFPVSITDPTTGTTTSVSVPILGIALKALATNSQVEILSDPSILVVDNEEATITVGRNIPFPVSTSYSSTSSYGPITNYQREDVGITLKVTPQINESNYVTMELSLEVAEVEEDNSGLDPSQSGFITSTREIENVVVVQDNQTIVIGGLIGNTSTEVETKIPVLGDLPLVGVLFRGKRVTERKTNLLIFLTPHVINEPADLEEVYRIKWAQRQEFVNRFYGRTPEEQEEALAEMLGGSMNFVDKPSFYRTKSRPTQQTETIGMDGSIVPVEQPSSAVPDSTLPEATDSPTITSPPEEQ